MNDKLNFVKYYYKGCAMVALFGVQLDREEETNVKRLF